MKIPTNLKKLDWLFQVGLLVLFLYIISQYAFSTNSHDFKILFLKQLTQIEILYSDNEFLATALILTLHLTASFFSFPACALLNIGSGYLFGFWKGTLLIYSVSMFSAVLGYFTGRWHSVAGGMKAIEHRGIIYMVLLRLTPFLPFGLLNLSFGYSRVPFLAFFISTFVGIFFDVVLLNKIGSSIREVKNTTVDDYLTITGLFLILMLVALRFFSKKAGQLNEKKL